MRCWHLWQIIVRVFCSTTCSFNCCQTTFVWWSCQASSGMIRASSRQEQMNCGWLDLQLHRFHVSRDHAKGLIMAKTSNVVTGTRRNYVFILNVSAIKLINVVPHAAIRETRQLVVVNGSDYRPKQAVFYVNICQPFFMCGIVQAYVIF